MPHPRHALVLCAAAIAALGTASAANTPLVRSAAYEFRYFGQDLGDESFTIARHADGYRVEASLSLRAGGQKPSETLHELDADRRLVRAVYRELEAGGDHAEYSIENGVLIARCLRSLPAEEVRIPLEPGALVTGPHYVSDFFLLDPLGLAIGEETTRTAWTFGFEGWRPSRVTLTVRREQDKEVKDLQGNRVRAAVYRCTIETGEDTFRKRSYLGPDGAPVRVTVNAPIGSMNVILDDDRPARAPISARIGRLAGSPQNRPGVR